jgi:hypothetical protein
MLLNMGMINNIRILKRETVEIMTSNELTNEMMSEDGFFRRLLSGMGPDWVLE